MSDSGVCARVMEGLMKRFVLASALALLPAAALAGTTGDPGPASPSEPRLDQVCAAAERFRDLPVALAEDYARDPMTVCGTADLLGQPAKLGRHGVALLAARSSPNHGTAQSACRAVGHKVPPSFHGAPYDRMADDPATKVDEYSWLQAPYDRHVSIFRDKPSGVVAQYNPNASCKAAKAANMSAMK